ESRGRTQCDRPPEIATGSCSGGVSQRAQARDGQPLEDVSVELSFVGSKQIAVWLAGNPRLPVGGLVPGEEPAQLSDVGMHQVARGGWGSLAPYLAYQPRG